MSVLYHVQARGDPEKTLYLVGTLNMLVRIQVMNWLEWIRIFIFHLGRPIAPQVVLS